jgi:hypothetical protein
MAMASEEAEGPREDTHTTHEDRSEAGCSFQETAHFAERFARLGLEAAATPLSWLPDPARQQLRHRAAGALRGLAVAPRVLSGLLDEVAREVEVPMRESDLGHRRQETEKHEETGEAPGTGER